MIFLYKAFSDLLLINWVLLSTSPSDRVSNMIHNFDRYVGFIPLGMLASTAETSDSIAWAWSGPRITSILYSRLVIVVTYGEWNRSQYSLDILQLYIEELILDISTLKLRALVKSLSKFNLIACSELLGNMNKLGWW